MKYNEIATGKRVCFSFSRMQPPTIGHGVLVDSLLGEAEKQGADSLLFLSQTCDKKRNPLSWEQKRGIASECFEGISISEETSVKTPYQALEHLLENYEHVTLVVGSDRVDEFAKMHDYAKEWGAKSFQIISAGERDSLSEGAEGASGTKARDFALDGNYDAFRAILPTCLSEDKAELIYKTIRGE